MFTTITDIYHINVCENQVCSSCVIDKFLITKQIRTGLAMHCCYECLFECKIRTALIKEKPIPLTPRLTSARTLPDQRPLCAFSELRRAAFPLLPTNCRNRCWSSYPWSGGHGTSCRHAGRSTRWDCS